MIRAAQKLKTGLDWTDPDRTENWILSKLRTEDRTDYIWSWNRSQKIRLDRDRSGIYQFNQYLYKI